MTLRTLAARKAAAVRHHGADDPRALEAAAALRTARLRKAITEAASVAPPLTRAEVTELTALLAGTAAS